MDYVEKLLGANEQVVLVTRQHWSVLVKDALVNLFIAVIAVGIAMITWSLAQPWGLLGALLLLIPAARFVLQFVHWVNREFIVTNRRVIQIEGVINKNVIDSSLEKVNDVRMSQSVLGRFFNYGDLEILTASELGINAFRRINDPIRFKTAMLNQKEKLGFDEIPSGESGAKPPAAADVPALIAGLSALRSQGMITEEEYQKKKAELLARM